jgi:hypothetical protein
MSTFEQALDLVAELPLEQQELLIDIVQRRTAEARRQELARTSQQRYSNHERMMDLVLEAKGT